MRTGASALLMLCAMATARADDSPLAAKAQGILKQHCHQCHGNAGTSKGGMGYLLDRDRLIERGQVVPGDLKESVVYQRIVAGEMPPPKQPRLQAAEVGVLKQWIEAGAPGWSQARPRPDFVSEQQIYDAIQEDLKSLPAKQRKFARYFTAAHLLNARHSDKDIDTCRLALGKLLNSLSWHPKVAEPRDLGNGLYRIDLREYKWPAAAWDRLLRDYPYKAPGIEPLAVRADWFIATASRPPLYGDLLELPSTDRALERLLQVEVIQNIVDENCVRAGFNDSGVSKNNRVLERHDAVYGAYWRSYDFADNKGRQSIFEHPLGPANGETSFKPDGGEMIFHLPNGLHGYMIVDGAGKRIDKAPVEIVADPLRSDQRVETGISCMSCHSKGYIPKGDQVWAHVWKNAKAFARAEFDTVRALYSRNRVPKLVEEDNARYLAALDKLHVSVNDPDPVNAVTLRYEATLTLADAAAELAMPDAEFRKRLAKTPDLQRILGPLLVKGGTIQRKVFQQGFAQFLDEMRDAAPAPAVARAFSGFTGSIHAIALHTDSSHVAAGGDDKVLRLWDLAKGHEVRQFRGHKDEVTCAAFSPGGLWLVSGGRDRTVRLWDVASGKELRALVGHTAAVRCVAVSPDGWVIASGGDDHAIRLWEQQTGKEIRSLGGHTASVRALAWSANGKWLYSAAADGSARKWDAAKGQEVLRFDGHKGSVTAVAVSPDGKRLLTGGSDGSVRLWDAATGKELQVMKGHVNGVAQVAFVEGGKAVSAATQFRQPDAAFRLWDLMTGKEIRRWGEAFDGNIAAVALAAGGTVAVSGGTEEALRVWELK
jgi:mono/diheme cytochrome c family protein